MEREYRDSINTGGNGGGERQDSGAEVEQELQSFIGRTEGLLSDISTADARTRSGESGAAASIDGTPHEAYDPALPSRYDAATLLLSAVAAVLRDNREGVASLDENPGYLRQKLNSAIGRYGLKVIEEETPASSHGKYLRRLKQERERFTGTNGDTLPLSEDTERDAR